MRKITVVPGEATFDREGASRIIGQLKSKPDSVIGLSTGRTTGNMHRLTAAAWQTDPFDVSKATFFGVDEVTGVDREYPGACYAMLRNELIGSLPVKAENFLMLPTRSDDYESACAAFTAELDRRGGIDLLVLGLGENGHLGFNNPGAPFDGTAWHTRMHPELEERIRRETGSCEPLGGITLGIKDIMHARHIVLVAKGDNKSAVVEAILEGPVTEALPGSVLQLHPDIEYLLDAKAAKKLKIAK